MRIVQMTLDDDLVNMVDKVVVKLHTTRSAFTRRALRNAVNDLSLSRLEQKHRKGYEKHPVKKTEFSVWDNEQVWGDA